MNTKNNRRAQRTRQQLQQAFLQLIEEMPPEQLSVSALCRQAGVNRSSFYAHYDGIPDLMTDIQREISRSLGSAFSWLHDPETEFATLRAFTTMLEHIIQHKHFYRLYAKSAIDLSYLQLGRDYIKETLVRPYCHRRGLSDEAWIDYAYESFLAGCSAVICRWLELDCPEPPAEMAKILYYVVAHGSDQAASDATE